MGIPQIYNQWIRRIPKEWQVVKHLPGHITSFRSPEAGRMLGGNPEFLYLDMNGIFHHAAQITYGYGEGSKFVADENKNKTDSELEQTYIQQILREIEEIIDFVSPSLVFLCVDGVAPVAKIAQQRLRRYKSLAEPPSEPMRFDPNQITPFTPLMQRIDTALKAWIPAYERRKLSPGAITYLSQYIDGEGEHKIFAMFKKKGSKTPLLGQILDLPSVQRMREMTRKSNRALHIVYGLDADLIILSLLAKLGGLNPHIVLLRERTKDVVFTNALYDYITNSPGSHRQNQYSDFVRNFVYLVSLFGNDFLPKTHSFTGDTWKDLSRLLHLSGRQVERGLDNEKASLFGFLSEWNKETFVQGHAPLETYLHQLMPDPQRAAPVVDPVLHSAFYDCVSEKSQDYIMRKTNFYALLMEHQAAGVPYALAPFNRDLCRETFKELCHLYFMGMDWCFQYYEVGLDHADRFHFAYPSHTAPLTLHLQRHIDQFKTEAAFLVEAEATYYEIPQHPKWILQLASVLPKASLQKANPALYAYATNGWMRYLFPERLLVQDAGTTASWQAKAIVPIPDFRELVQELEEAEQRGEIASILQTIPPGHTLKEEFAWVHRHVASYVPRHTPKPSSHSYHKVPPPKQHTYTYRAPSAKKDVPKPSKGVFDMSVGAAWRNI